MPFLSVNNYSVDISPSFYLFLTFTSVITTHLRVVILSPLSLPLNSPITPAPICSMVLLTTCGMDVGHQKKVRIEVSPAVQMYKKTISPLLQIGGKTVTNSIFHATRGR